jgi:hypothetical protein
MKMDGPNIAMYAGDPLGPAQFDGNLPAVKSANWTTVILSFVHISDEERFKKPDGSILFFNEARFIEDQQVLPPFATWNASLAQLKQGGTISKLYMSIGGGDPVRDFKTIQRIYSNNGNSFDKTPLLKNLVWLRNSFPVIDGIDMDCEDIYDQASFLAFCKLVHDIGFEITFCPWEKPDFWIGSLQQIQESTWGLDAVKWFNLQSYAFTDPPAAPGVWADLIKKQMPGFNTDSFILAGAWARYKNSPTSWDKACPGQVEDTLKYLIKSGHNSVGGGFIWNMDCMLQTTNDPGGCNGIKTMKDYVAAINEAMEEGGSRG